MASELKWQSFGARSHLWGSEGRTLLTAMEDNALKKPGDMPGSQDVKAWVSVLLSQLPTACNPIQFSVIEMVKQWI